MNLKAKSLIKPILIGLSLLLLSLNFIDKDINEQLAYDHKEQFDPRLSYINSIDKLEAYIDSIEVAKKISRNSIDYVVVISQAISNRFYHGFSHFTLKENWIAAFCERVAGYGLASKVKADDIMEHSNAACSQQAMIMMEVLKRKKITYRSVGFPHHFALEVLVDGKWNYFDPNMEPNMGNDQRREDNWKCCADTLKRYYDTSRFHDLDWKFGKNLMVTQGKENASYAGNAKLFQAATGIASKIAWCLPLMILVYRSRKNKRNEA